MQRIRAKFRAIWVWAKAHPIASVAIAVGAFLAHEWSRDLLSKLVFDKINTKIVDAASYLVVGEGRSVTIGVMSYVQNIVFVIILAALFFYAGRWSLMATSTSVLDGPTNDPEASKAMGNKDNQDSAPLATNERQSAVPPNQVQNETRSAPNGYVLSDRIDFDLVIKSFVLRAVRTQDGVDVTALLFYRNRSQLPLVLKLSQFSYQIEGKRPFSDKPPGISSPLHAEKDNGIRFAPIRIYDESHRRGSALVSIVFRRDRETAGTILRARFDFEIENYDFAEGTDAALKARIEQTVHYFVRA